MSSVCDTTLSPYKGRNVSCYQHVAIILTPGGNKQPDRIVTNLYDVWSVLCFTPLQTTDSRDISFNTVIRVGTTSLSSWDRLWSTMSTTLTQFLQLVPGASGWGVTLTPHLSLVLRLGLHGAKPKIHLTP